MLNCQNATRLISESQERALSLREDVPLKLHLLICAGCRNFKEQVPFLGEAMRAFAKREGDEAQK